jgi:hypothetical protein
MVNVARDLNARLVRVPEGLRIEGPRCGTPEAVYDPERRRIVFCIELTDELITAMEEVESSKPTSEAFEAAMFFIFHEVGHALIDIYDLPITGSGEDAADQFAAWWLISVGAGHYLGMASYMFLVWREDYRDPGGIQQYGHVHALPEQRHLNLICWMVGSEMPLSNEALEWLPAERLLQCDAEYERISRAWERLLTGKVRRF